MIIVTDNANQEQEPTGLHLNFAQIIARGSLEPHWINQVHSQNWVHPRYESFNSTKVELTQPSLWRKWLDIKQTEVNNRQFTYFKNQRQNQPYSYSTRNHNPPSNEILMEIKTRKILKDMLNAVASILSNSGKAPFSPSQWIQQAYMWKDDIQKYINQHAFQNHDRNFPMNEITLMFIDTAREYLNNQSRLRQFAKTSKTPLDGRDVIFTFLTELWLNDEIVSPEMSLHLPQSELVEEFNEYQRYSREIYEFGAPD